MTQVAIDQTDCDREPIHIPGAIQPHGVLLVVDPDRLIVTHAAGAAEVLFATATCLGRPVGELAPGIVGDLARVLAGSGGFVGPWRAPDGRLHDVSAHRSDDVVLIEFEPGPPDIVPASAILGALEQAGAAFERASGLTSLCEQAAADFRALTGFDRVMIYHFLDDEAGAVLAEAKDPAMPSFLHHHFPGSDIPRQARALYVRNLVRVIPDVTYVPAPLRPDWRAAEALDMSDAVLRSVSPIHMQYLRNMRVGASASISIVKDGVLWGLIACHNAAPKLLTYDLRAACRALAGGLARQIKAKEEAQAYRERIRLRSLEDEVIAHLTREGPLDDAIRDNLTELRRMLTADGVAVLRGGDLVTAGICPPETEVRDLAGWILGWEHGDTFVTDRLPELYTPANAFRPTGSGVLSLAVSHDEPFLILWFRAEQVETVNWAGNPHKAATGPGGALTPRASFEAWSESVRGRSAAWTPAQADAAVRLKQTLLEARQTRRLRDLNLRLTDTVADKDALIRQKEVLIREVNHRMQNSLQLVSSFLALQARDSGDAALQEALEEARRRISAVALVHRRLYRADQIETIDLGRYLEELCGEVLATMDADWTDKLTLDIAPILISTDRAVTLGLVLTELVINANKYAYGGAPGPIIIGLAQHRGSFRLTVADRGTGKHKPGEGFGSRMMRAMVSQLAGELAYEDNQPGVRAILAAPIATPA